MGAVMAENQARIKELFLAALDLPDAASQATFVDRECGADAELKSRVLALLAAHAAPHPAAVPPSAASDQPTSLHAAGAPAAGGESEGSIIAGKFKLLQHLG